MNAQAKGLHDDPFRLEVRDEPVVVAVWGFMRERPLRNAAILALLTLSGIAEGVGILGILPLIGNFVETSSDQTIVSQSFNAVLSTLNLPQHPATMLTLIVIMMVTKALLALSAMSLVGFSAAGYVLELRTSLLRGLLHARWPYFLTRPIGSFSNAVGVEATIAGSVYTQAFQILAVAIQVIIYLAAASLISWKATVAGLVCGVFIALALGRLISIAKTAGRRQRIAYESLSSRLADGIQGIKPLKAMASEDSVSHLWERKIGTLNKTFKVSILSQEVLRAGQESLVIVFLALGFYFALQTNIEFDLLLVMAVFFIRTVGRVNELQRSYQHIVRNQNFNSALLRKIDEVGAAQETLGGCEAPVLSSSLDIRNLTFSYAERGPALREVSLSIPSGCLTTIYGPSGAGKTTLVDLIIGLYEPDSGEILVEGEPLSLISKKSWRSQIGYVPQDLFLFHDTILQNVTLGISSITQNEVEVALRRAGAWEFTASLPEGLYTVPGERGAKLSGGQRQRIGIARALVRNPRLLILDEPTSSLDPATEESICRTLRSLAGSVTMLAISHQRALVDISDIVYRLNEGRIDSGDQAEREKRMIGS